MNGKWETKRIYEVERTEGNSNMNSFVGFSEFFFLFFFLEVNSNQLDLLLLQFFKIQWYQQQY